MTKQKPRSTSARRRTTTSLAFLVLSGLLGCAVSVQQGASPNHGSETQGGEAKAGKKEGKRKPKPSARDDKDEETSTAAKTPRDDQEPKPKPKPKPNKDGGNDKPQGGNANADEGKKPSKDTSADEQASSGGNAGNNQGSKDDSSGSADGHTQGGQGGSSTPSGGDSGDTKTQVTPDKDKDKDKDKEEISSLVIPVRIALADAVAKVDELVPKTVEEKDWVRVTKSGASPEVEIHYNVWREKLKVSFDDGKLKVVVPLHYAANYRAKIKNPVPMTNDWIWLTHDDTWGTKSDPQDLTVTLELKPKVDADWKIVAEPRLDTIAHGKAPKGNACVKVGVKACVEKETLAPEIRSHIDDYLVPKIESELKKVDRELAGLLQLEKRARQVWRSLSKPLSLQKVADAKCPTELAEACKVPAWVVVAPSSVGVSPLVGNGKEIGIDLAMTGRLAVVVGDKPAVEDRPLPQVSKVKEAPEVQLFAQLHVSKEVLDGNLAKALKGQAIKVAGKPDLKIEGVELALPKGDKATRRISLSAKVSGALDAELSLRGDLAYDAESGLLSVSSIAYDDTSAALISKELGAAAQEALSKKLAEGASIKLGGQVKLLKQAIKSALDDNLKGELTLKGKLDTVSLRNVAVKDDITLTLALSGKLAVAYAPE